MDQRVDTLQSVSEYAEGLSEQITRFKDLGFWHGELIAPLNAITDNQSNTDASLGEMPQHESAHETGGPCDCKRDHNPITG
jgi:phage-related minor tail protein